MRVLLPLAAVLALGVVAGYGSESPGMRQVLGIGLPYLCVAVFVAGVIYRVVSWARSPVPFRIPATCGQQKSLPWIRPQNLENPHNTLGVLGRMVLEVVLFRSLFRNTETTVVGEKVLHGPNKWLWAGGLAFHGALAIILIRHLRFFVEPVPAFVKAVQFADGFLEIFVPVLYASTMVFLGALGYLLLRRLWFPPLRYLSLPADYFALWLLLGIGGSGALLRHLGKTDIVHVKGLVLDLFALQPSVPEGLHPLFWAHLLLVCVLLAYFPFSKLMHFAGVFMSPTRNLANTNRAVHHENPWNYPVTTHPYPEYEDEFREKMKAAGIPVEKEE